MGYNSTHFYKLIFFLRLLMSQQTAILNHVQGQIDHKQSSVKGDDLQFSRDYIHSEKLMRAFCLKLPHSMK